MEHQKLTAFPDDFLLGSASAYQVEGAWQDGQEKGESVWIALFVFQVKTFKRNKWHLAVDHYHRYKEDIALMKNKV